MKGCITVIFDRCQGERAIVQWAPKCLEVLREGSSFGSPTIADHGGRYRYIALILYNYSACQLSGKKIMVVVVMAIGPDPHIYIRVTTKVYTGTSLLINLYKIL